MNRTRGILLMVAAAFVFFQGWRLHTVNPRFAVMSAVLGLLALGLGIWRLRHK